MEEFGLRHSASATASLQAKQAELKDSLSRNDESYASIKSSLTSIITAAANSKVLDERCDSSSDDNSSICTVIDREDIPEHSNEKDECITMKKFLLLVSQGKIHEDVLNKIHVLNVELEETKKVSDDLRAQFSVLGNELKEIKRNINNIKQYLKLENLLFHNFYLPPGYKHMSSLEFSYFMAQQINHLIPQLDYPVSWEHISTAHPLKTKRKTSNVIVVRFCNRNIRDEIFAKRHFISKKGCGITEHLTEINLEVFKKAKSLFGFDNVSTLNCNVFVMINGVRKFVRSSEHVIELFESINAVDRNILTYTTSSTSQHQPPGKHRGYGKSHRGGYAKRGHYSVRNRQY